jgi:hypothetical protein
MLVTHYQNDPLRLTAEWRCGSLANRLARRWYRRTTRELRGGITGGRAEPLATDVDNRILEASAAVHPVSGKATGQLRTRGRLPEGG